MTENSGKKFRWVWLENYSQWVLFYGKRCIGANNPVSLTILAGRRIPKIPYKERQMKNGIYK